MVLLEQIKTIDKRRVKKYLGRMTRQQMDEIGEAIEEALGCTSPKKWRPRNESRTDHRPEFERNARR